MINLLQRNYFASYFGRYNHRTINKYLVILLWLQQPAAKLAIAHYFSVYILSNYDFTLLRVNCMTLCQFKAIAAICSASVFVVITALLRLDGRSISVQHTFDQNQPPCQIAEDLRATKVFWGMSHVYSSDQRSMNEFGEHVLPQIQKRCYLPLRHRLHNRQKI
jgi:hypothetical protein